MNIVQKEVFKMPKIIPNLKETIVIEAKHMLIKDGYENFNMRDIAKKCSVGVGTLYNYFPNKDNLAIAIFLEDWNQVITNVKSLETKNCTLKTKIYEIYENINEFLKNYMGIFMEMAYSSKESRYDRKDIMNPIYKSIETILKYHKGIGELNCDVPLDKEAYFIVANLVNLCREKFLTFDELYSCMKLS